MTVNLVDTTPPVITPPADVFTTTNTSQATVNLGTASAVDNVNGAVAVTNNAPASFPVGVTTVTYTATDAAGNVATATDAFAVTVTNDAPAVFPVGTTTVTWTATDANGNVTSGPQTVTVNLVDTTPPMISVPADVFSSTNAPQATVNIGTATATDNVDGMVAVTNNAPASFPVGVTTITTEAVYWHHNDHLGTPQALTDSNGTVVWTMSQTPFGMATVNEDPDGDGLTVTNNFRFPGQYFDAETGLNYNYQRTYDPALGRYTQSDPIGLQGGMNTFAYVGGNPLIYIDSLGLWRIDVGGSFFGFDYTSTFYDSESNTGLFGTGFVPIQDGPSRTISATFIGGGISIVFPQESNENTPCEGWGWKYGLNKYLGFGFNNSRSEISISVGVAAGTLITPEVPLNPDGVAKW